MLKQIWQCTAHLKALKISPYCYIGVANYIGEAKTWDNVTMLTALNLDSSQGCVL